MNSAGKLTTVFLGIAATAVMVQSRASALTTPEIQRIARGVTVQIESQSPGSGVIIKQAGQTYTVLTASHVVTNSGRVTVKTYNGQSYAPKAVLPLPGVDLAIVQFISTTTYPVAKAGNSNQIAGDVYVSGYSLPSAALNNTVYHFTEGTVMANAVRPLQNGYSLIYSNQTLPGMGGGPVLDRNGQLVGIHSLSNPPIRIQRQGINPLYSHAGSNLGLPINSFLKRISAAGVNLGEFPVPQFTAPPSADDYFVRAETSVQNGNYQKAIADYTEAIRRRPDFAAAYGNRQKIHFWLGNYNAAISDGTQAIKLNPFLAEAYIFLGGAYGKLDNLKGQLANFDQAVSISSNSADAYSYRSYTHYLLSNYRQALADAEKAVQLDPQSAWAYAVRGIAKSELGQPEGALEDGNSAIQYDPNAVDGWFARSLIQLKLKDYANAIASADQALTINPRFVEAYITRAAARFRQGNRKGALADLNQAFALDPNNVTLRRQRQTLMGAS
ncbi:MAG: tetratricopeptide repeat protein [Thermosynechococcaceae cyanobacterium]